MNGLTLPTHPLCQPIPAWRHYWSQNDKRKSHSQAIHAEVKDSFLEAHWRPPLIRQGGILHGLSWRRYIYWMASCKYIIYIYLDINLHNKYFLVPSLGVCHSHGNFCATDWKVGELANDSRGALCLGIICSRQPCCYLVKLAYNIRYGHSVTSISIWDVTKDPKILKKSDTVARPPVLAQAGNCEFKPDGAKANSPPARGQNIMFVSCLFYVSIIWLFLCPSASVSTTPVSTRPWRTAMEALCPLLGDCWVCC